MDFLVLNIFMEFSKITKIYWREKDWQDLEIAESISDLFKIAERIIDRMDKPFVQVCGPIGTGGLGSVEANLNAFNNTIIKLQHDGLNVFDQMPFEIPIQRIKERLIKDGGYFSSILTDFYCPIFTSGLVSAFYFMPNWQTSFGAKWEHEEAKKLGIKIIYL